MASRVSQKVAVSVVYVAAMFMTIMDATIVNVALPTIGRSFGVPSTSVASVSIYFLVSLAVFISASGWLGDRFGGKRVLLAAIVVFTAASALCGMAGSLAELDIFRVLQGVGGGMMAPVGLAMLFRAFPPAERVRASSILTVPTTLAPALGPIVGGLLVTELSWRWVFYVNVPLGMLALAFGVLFLEGGNALAPGPFDAIGFLLAGAGLGLLMYGVSEGPIRHWSSGVVQATIAAGTILLAVLVLAELRKRQPLIDLRLLGNRLFRSANAVMLLASAAFIGTLYVVSLFYQDGRGLSALGSGLSTFPEAIGVMAGAQLASRVLYPVLGPRWNIAVGLLGVTASIGLMSLVGAQTSLWWMRLLLFCLGVAMGQVFVPAQAAAFATISPEATGRASTIFNVFRQLGSAVGVAVFTTAIVAVGATKVMGGRVAPDLAAYHVAFLVAAGLAAVGALIALTIHDADAAATRVRRGERSAGSARLANQASGAPRPGKRRRPGTAGH
ncbi:MAG TPA: MDR family MFS transporter [Streptosporangiaceae bacterium]|nr:MDR family MFS transporter [Streptosporangiaceae bacterium]